MNHDLYPLTFEPVYKDYPWGGRRVPETYDRDAPPGACAESWEIADHDDGMSVVANGALRGETLRDVLQSRSKEILGPRVAGERFPLLIKLIDAKQKLSVQVHPNDETAARFGGEAKTEAWYMLGENPARVYCGLKDGVTRDSFLEAARDDTSGETMRALAVNEGDTVLVRGGSVHAIDAGCFILEVQQNSNTTYRIYDWGRLGNDGQPRELHIDQAMNVINWDQRDNPVIRAKSYRSNTDAWEEILSCEYFTLEKATLTDVMPCETGDGFNALFVAQGRVEIQWGDERMSAAAGTSVLIPAALSSYALRGPGVVLRTSIP